MKNVTTLVLGGGRGSRLYPLTKVRAKPAVPLAAKYRLIDIPLSNCINSGLNHVYVLTQFLSVSLHRHIRLTYRFDNFSGGFVELLAAQQTADEGTDWYQGTADAVRKNIRYMEQPGIEYVLILSGDQLYRMDYRDMLQTHQQSGAQVTIGAIPVTRKAAGAFGIMRIDDTGRVCGFLEKPQTDAEIDMVRLDPAWIDKQGIASGGRECLASMGIYVFNRDFLLEVLRKTTYQDFGKEVFPAAFRSRHVQVHLFDGYWEDIGTIRAFYDANLGLTQPDPPFQLTSPTAPVYSRARYLPPSLMQGAQIKGSLIADGCRIGKGAVIENSVIGLRCIIGENVTIRNSIVMGADLYEQQDVQRPCGPDHPVLGIGSGSVIEGAIVDKNCRIGSDVRVINEQGIENGEDNPDCVIRDGIPVVVKSAELKDGWRVSG
ncbi:MAG: glucose-1-phosphate adenylyltransferase [Pirellulaceae bacterium]